MHKRSLSLTGEMLLTSYETIALRVRFLRNVFFP
jgi:hypothetical protein